MQRFAISILLTCGGLLGQDRIHSCVYEAPDPAVFTKQRQADGSWAEIVVAKGAPPAEVNATKLRATATVILALLADGTTMRSGPEKIPLKAGVKWLRDQIDKSGRIALRTDPGWFVDHALGCFALSEAMRRSTYRILWPHIANTSGALAAHLERKGILVSAELLFWSRATVDSMQRFAHPAEKVRQPVIDRLRAAVIKRHASLRSATPSTDLEKAVELSFLVDSATGPEPSARLRNALETSLGRRSGLGTMDPLAAAIYSAAIYRYGGARWKIWTQTIQGMLNGVPQRPVKNPGRPRGSLESDAWKCITLTAYSVQTSPLNPAQMSISSRGKSVNSMLWKTNGSTPLSAHAVSFALRSSFTCRCQNCMLSSLSSAAIEWSISGLPK